MFKQYTLVKFDYKALLLKYHKFYPFKENEHFVFLGEIVQMPGHCIVISMSDGKIYTGYHTENFIECTEDEV